MSQSGFPCPNPSEFMIQVLGKNPNPSFFADSSGSAGTEVTLEDGNHKFYEQALQIPPDLVLQPPNFSPGRSGTISAGQSVGFKMTN